MKQQLLATHPQEMHLFKSHPNAELGFLSDETTKNCQLNERISPANAGRLLGCTGLKRQGTKLLSQSMTRGASLLGDIVQTAG